MIPTLTEILQKELSSKRIILTASPGRCGTMLLASMLNLLPYVTAVHEPKPRLDDIWWRFRTNPKLMYSFLTLHKLPAILQSTDPTYVETTHLLCKGFFEALERLGVPFDIIILGRDRRKIALSMYRLADIPGRTKSGKRWYLQPWSPSPELSFYGPEWLVYTSQYPKYLHTDQYLTDYELCYWYVLEMECRLQSYYDDYAHNTAKTVAVTSLSKIITKNGFCDLLHDLNIPIPSKRILFQHRIMSMERMNEKRSRKGHTNLRFKLQPIEDIEASERKVRELTGYERLGHPVSRVFT